VTDGETSGQADSSLMTVPGGEKCSPEDEVAKVSERAEVASVLVDFLVRNDWKRDRVRTLIAITAPECPAPEAPELPHETVPRVALPFHLARRQALGLPITQPGPVVLPPARSDQMSVLVHTEMYDGDPLQTGVLDSDLFEAEPEHVRALYHRGAVVVRSRPWPLGFGGGSYRT